MVAPEPDGVDVAEVVGVVGLVVGVVVGLVVGVVVGLVVGVGSAPPRPMVSGNVAGGSPA